MGDLKEAKNGLNEHVQVYFEAKGTVKRYKGDCEVQVKGF